MDKFTALLAQGYKPEEAELVLRVTAVALQDHDRASETGLCACGGQLQQNRFARECTRCPVVLVA